MGDTTESVEVDGDKLMQFVFRAVDEVGAVAETPFNLVLEVRP